MAYIFFHRKLSGCGVKSEIMLNKKLAEKLLNSIIRKFEKRKVYSSFKDNIWGADLSDMQVISKFSKGFRFLLCVKDIYTKYVWVVSLKDEKGITITKAFQEVLDKSGRKPNKIGVDKGSEFYNRLIKSWLHDSDVEMYWIHNLLLLKDLLEP